MQKRRTPLVSIFAEKLFKLLVYNVVMCLVYNVVMCYPFLSHKGKLNTLFYIAVPVLSA